MSDSCILQGTQEYINDCFEAAVIKFTEAYNLDNHKISALLYRGSSLISLGQYQKAIEDFNLVEQSGEKLFETFYKRGIAYFYLEDFKVAYDNFLKAVAISQFQEQRDNVDKWMSKIKIESKQTGLPLSTNTNISANTQMFTQSWKQDNRWIYIHLESKSAIDTNALKVNLLKRAVNIIYNNTDVYSLSLCNAIKPVESSFEILENALAIDIKIKKEIDNFDWINVDQDKLGQNNTTLQSYPSSSKKKKDWDQIDKEITKQLNAEPEDEGFNALMKQIYSRGDEETRRAMIKSMQTSGGTVLSTNWGEVAAKDYEGKDRPEAPKGQEWGNKQEAISRANNNN